MWNKSKECLIIESMNLLLKSALSGQEILDSLPFYVLFLVNSQRCILAGNIAFMRDLELDPARLAGSYCPALIHGCETPVTNCPLAGALKNGRAAEREIFDSKTGKWLNAAVYPTPVLAENGEPVYLHFARDITEFKKTSRDLSLKSSPQKFKENITNHSRYNGDLEI